MSKTESLRTILRAIRAGIDEAERLLEGEGPGGGTDVPAWARLKVAAGLQAERPSPPPPPEAPAIVEQAPVPPGEPACSVCETKLVQFGRKRFCMTCQEERP